MDPNILITLKVAMNAMTIEQRVVFLQQLGQWSQRELNTLVDRMNIQYIERIIREPVQETAPND